MTRAVFTPSGPVRGRWWLRYWPFVLGVAFGLHVAPSKAVAQSVCAGTEAVQGQPDSLIADCDTLMGIKDALRGAARLDWLTRLPLSYWDGISISGGRVSALELDGVSRQRLTGRIPAEIGQLTGLTHLDLGSNRLTGEIPAELRRLARLTSLELDGNDLTGRIPVEIGQLTGLSHLDLGFNRLTGEIPVEFGRLTGLAYLRLGPNRLTGTIPAELGNLFRLTYLDLSSNGHHGLTGRIPAELGQLSRLTVLDLNNQALTGSIPPQLGNLSKLETLYLYSNRLTGGVPVDLSRLESLTSMDLSGNDLTGRVPPELSRLSNLFGLYLANNDLTGTIPPALGGMASVIQLELNGNDLTGRIPPELEKLTKLNSLSLYRNRLRGCVPAGLRRFAGERAYQINPQRNDIVLPVCAAPPQAFPTVWISDANVAEGDSGINELTFTLSRGVADSRRGRIRYATSGGTAVAGADFQPTRGVLEFEPSRADGVIVVPVHGDTDVEPDETVHVVLSDAENVELGRSSAVGLILDDDGGTGGSYTECHPTSTPLVFDGGYKVSLCYETADGEVGEGKGGIWASGQSGLLWFFDRENAEMLIKVLDGCAQNRRRWVFVAPVTDVAFNLHVTDSRGLYWTHRNRLGVTASTRSDTNAFPCE